MYTLNRDRSVQQQCREHPEAVLADYDLDPEERKALAEGDIGLLYVLGVNGQILMHYAAFLGIEWFDYSSDWRWSGRSCRPSMSRIPRNGSLTTASWCRRIF